MHLHVHRIACTHDSFTVSSTSTTPLAPSHSPNASPTLLSNLSSSAPSPLSVPPPFLRSFRRACSIDRSPANLRLAVRSPDPTLASWFVAAGSVGRVEVDEKFRRRTLWGSVTSGSRSPLLGFNFTLQHLFSLPIPLPGTILLDSRQFATLLYPSNCSPRTALLNAVSSSQSDCSQTPVDRSDSKRQAEQSVEGWRERRKEEDVAATKATRTKATRTKVTRTKVARRVQEGEKGAS